MRLVPEIKPAEFVGLVAGTKKLVRAIEFDAKYEYTAGDWFPRQVPATSSLSSVCLA